MADRLYKSLRQGSVAPFSERVWRVGEWVVADGDLEPCANGVHVCRPQDLPYWLSDELWEVDVEGEQIEHERKLVVRRARLRVRVDGWPNPLGSQFAVDCAWQVRDLVVSELQRIGAPEAEALVHCRSLPALGERAANTAEARSPDRPALVGEFLGYAQDVAEYAQEAPATAARYVSYIAAHTASRTTPTERMAPGATLFARERERQANVLHELGV